MMHMYAIVYDLSRSQQRVAPSITVISIHGDTIHDPTGSKTVDSTTCQAVLSMRAVFIALIAAASLSIAQCLKWPDPNFDSPLRQSPGEVLILDSEDFEQIEEEASQMERRAMKKQLRKGATRKVLITHGMLSLITVFLAVKGQSFWPSVYVHVGFIIAYFWAPRYNLRFEAQHVDNKLDTIIMAQKKERDLEKELQQHLDSLKADRERNGNRWKDEYRQQVYE